jgi:dTDP-4-dehydrorhamnose reductase
MKILLILGHGGMLGNAVRKYFNLNHEIEVVEKWRWDSKEFQKQVLNSNAEFIINCIGAIPQKKYKKEQYELLNVILPIFLESTGKKIIHPSTDCEFSGKLEYPLKYAKNSVRDADDDYGMSKVKISEMIENNFKNTKIIRTSIIGHEINNHFSLLDWFLSVDESESINGYTNHYWNGITTLQWAKIAENLMLNWNDADIITQVGIDGLSKYELLEIVKEVYCKKTKINSFATEVSLNKMLETDVIVPTIKEQLIELKNFYFPELESCVWCNELTDVPRDLDIDLRKNYVEGAGQLCPGCYNKLYDEREDKGSGNR